MLTIKNIYFIHFNDVNNNFYGLWLAKTLQPANRFLFNVFVP